jgi:hypothetical protein
VALSSGVCSLIGAAARNSRPNRDRSGFAVLTVVALLVAVLAGCGSSGKSQAQIRACWNQHLTQYVRQYDKQLGAGVGDKILPETAAAYESGPAAYRKWTANGLTTAAITARLKAIQGTCGKLHVTQ